MRERVIPLFILLSSHEHTVSISKSLENISLFILFMPVFESILVFIVLFLQSHCSHVLKKILWWYEDVSVYWFEKSKRDSCDAWLTFSFITAYLFKGLNVITGRRQQEEFPIPVNALENEGIELTLLFFFCVLIKIKPTVYSNAWGVSSLLTLSPGKTVYYICFADDSGILLNLMPSHNTRR